MPTIRPPEIRLPNVDPGQRELPAVDRPNVELPNVELLKVELSREIEERLPGRRRTNPLPFVLVGVAIIAAATWLAAWPPLWPRFRSAVADARSRLIGNRSTARGAGTDELDQLDELDAHPSGSGRRRPAESTTLSAGFEHDRSVVSDRPASDPV